MTTVAEALRDAARRLEAVTDTGRLDAELLMGEALGTSRSDLLLRRTRDPAPEAFEALLARRLEHEPVAQILGRKDFYGREFVVAPGVLIPRMDSETTVAAAILIAILVQRNFASLLMTGLPVAHGPFHGTTHRCVALRGSSSAWFTGGYRRSR